MRLASILVSMVVVVGLSVLTTLPSGYAQPVVTGTAQYLPVVFNPPPTPTRTATSLVSPTPLRTPTRTPPTIPPMFINGDFEQGGIYWFATGGGTVVMDATLAHSGDYFGSFDPLIGRDQSLFQDVVVPAGTPILVFWSRAASSQSSCASHTATVTANDEVLVTIMDFCLSRSGAYQRYQVDLTRFVGDYITLSFSITRPDAEDSFWYIDDAALIAAPTQ